MYYGPDTYMGRNLSVMLRAVSQLSDEEIAALHPAHNRASVKVQYQLYRRCLCNARLFL